ncbi:MAG: inorganic phosphate transporter [Alicyclobacillus sp.]|nr:inorganic phosphate transporter [Alicyclobacillus sp.]
MAVVLAVVLILAFTVVCGWNDGGNLLAALANTRVLRPLWALLLIAGAVWLGPFLLGTAVAGTVGTQIVDLRRLQPGALDLALASTLLTLVLSWRLRVPTSTTLALLGGLCGAGLVLLGPHGVVWRGLLKSLVSLLLAITLGGPAGWALYAVLRYGLRRANTRTGMRVGGLQSVTALLLCLGYGANDAEKSVGLLASLWAVLRHMPFAVRPWMVVLPALAFTVGLLWGGWRVARTVGFHIFRARPVHAFATQLAAAAVILGAAVLGGPVSSTQTLDSALVGVGAAARSKQVRWPVVRRMAWVWVVTLPLSFALASTLAGVYRVWGS